MAIQTATLPFPPRERRLGWSGRFCWMLRRPDQWLSSRMRRRTESGPGAVTFRPAALTYLALKIILWPRNDAAKNFLTPTMRKTFKPSLDWLLVFLPVAF